MHSRYLIAACALACGGHGQRFTAARSSVYVRSDTDRTTVITPKVGVAADVEPHTNVAASFEVDAWTGASVDVVTAATAAITERRDEANVSVAHERGVVRATASYRYSREPDYRSHGGVLGGRVDLANRNTTLGLDLLASGDTVGRAGDPFFERSLSSAGARASVTQLLDRRSLAELAWETTRLSGYQASPYRFVAIGGDGTCAGGAPFCVPEEAPDERWRNAVLLRTRRALARRASAGLEYRFYFDDWGVRSHAIQPDLAWRITGDGVLSLRYRYYTQGEATFYRPRYPDVGGYVTRDRKLSALFTHEAGASYLHRIELCDGARVIELGGRATGTRIEYLAFVGLERVWAAELTLMASLMLP